MQKYNKILLVSGDVFSCLVCGKEIGWEGIKEISFNRIIYLSAVLYSFRFPGEKNVFEDDYEFTITLRGPEAAIISNALIHLAANEIIIKTGMEYSLSSESEAFTQNLPYYQEKKSWIEDIIYIIGVYGEEKLYDFIFRDPEYKNNLNSKSSNPLDLSKNNYTILYLEKFKSEFEKTLSNSHSNLMNKQYLELYFEFVFSKILRGESIDG